MFRFFDLPDELQFRSLTFCPPGRLVILRQVSKRLKRMAEDTVLWNRFLHTPSHTTDIADKLHPFNLYKDQLLTIKPKHLLDYPIPQALRGLSTQEQITRSREDQKTALLIIIFHDLIAKDNVLPTHLSNVIHPYLALSLHILDHELLYSRLQSQEKWDSLLVTICHPEAALRLLQNEGLWESIIVRERSKPSLILREVFGGNWVWESFENATPEMRLDTLKQQTLSNLRFPAENSLEENRQILIRALQEKLEKKRIAQESLRLLDLRNH